MGKIKDLVNRIQKNETINSIQDVLTKYPHLAQPYYEELAEEKGLKSEDKQKSTKKLLLD